MGKKGDKKGSKHLTNQELLDLAYTTNFTQLLQKTGSRVIKKQASRSRKISDVELPLGRHEESRTPENDTFDGHLVYRPTSSVVRVKDLFTHIPKTVSNISERFTENYLAHAIDVIIDAHTCGVADCASSDSSLEGVSKKEYDRAHKKATAGYNIRHYRYNHQGNAGLGRHTWESKNPKACALVEQIADVVWVNVERFDPARAEAIKAAAQPFIEAGYKPIGKSFFMKGFFKRVWQYLKPVKTKEGGEAKGKWICLTGRNHQDKGGTCWSAHVCVMEQASAVFTFSQKRVGVETRSADIIVFDSQQNHQYHNHSFMGEGERTEAYESDDPSPNPTERTQRRFCTFYTPNLLRPRGGAGGSTSKDQREARRATERAAPLPRWGN